MKQPRQYLRSTIFNMAIFNYQDLMRNTVCLLAHECLQTKVWDVWSSSQAALQCAVAATSLGFLVVTHVAGLNVPKHNTRCLLAHLCLQTWVLDASACKHGCGTIGAALRVLSSAHLEQLTYAFQ